MPDRPNLSHPTQQITISGFSTALRSLGFALAWVLYAPQLLAAPANATPVAVAKTVAAGAAAGETFVGSIVAPQRVRLAPRVNGQIASMAVEEGATVLEGDALFELDAELATIAVEVARADLAEARAELDDAQRQAEEAERLIEKNYVPQTTLDSARALVAVRKATHARRTAELARERELLKRHTTVAPFRGTVVGKFAEVGQWVTTGGPVFELVALDPLRIVVPLPQRLFGDLSEGDPVRVQFDALGDATTSHTLSALIPNTDPASRTFPGWISVPNPDGKFIPGMSARVRLQSTGSAAALAVPNDAIVRRARGGVVVWRVTESEQGALIAEPVPITPGRVTGEHTEVAPSSLALGDLLVVRGNESLRPNTPVRLTGPP